MMHSNLRTTSFARQLLSLLLSLFAFATVLHAQSSQLGKVEFPTSGSEKAQVHFLRGLAALHSFWYEEALEAFRESTKVEPDFMMGYWGEAMAHNHPLWSEQDTAAARQVLGRIKDTAKLTARERAYIAAVKILYGEGDKPQRDRAYANAMEKLHQDYPEDLDAASFHALSLLGLVRFEDKSFRLQARAAAIALDVYQRNPNHPGAAHYIIHAFDDPEHAVLALPAARRYATIAPEAHHARHMPSHIFLQLGMWPEAAASNESAWESSDAWMKRKNLSLSVRDYHSLHWLLYIYLQQGRFAKAEELLALMSKTMTESVDDNHLRPNYYENNYTNMAAAFVVETERWKLASTLFPVDSRVNQPSAAGPEKQAPPGAHGAHGPTASSNVTAPNRARSIPLFIRGLAEAAAGSSAEQIVARLRASGAGSGPGSLMLQIRELEISALAASMKQEHDRAGELMTRAVGLEEQLGPPSGPPQMVKPAHELFGEILLRAGKPAEALQQFRTALLRQPNRARSLLGAGRAAAQAGDKAAAADYYSILLQQWKQADEGLAELREARDYLKQVARN